jgi:hypothetical protein
MFTESLPSNEYTRHIAPFLRLFVPNGLQAYRHFFFSGGCTCDICDRSRLLLVARLFEVFAVQSQTRMGYVEQIFDSRTLTDELICPLDLEDKVKQKVESEIY